MVVTLMTVNAQTALKKVYDETINPMEQIDRALATARSSQQPKLVICQVGGNWCPWCLRFADFAATDPDIAKNYDAETITVRVRPLSPRKSPRSWPVPMRSLKQKAH